MLLNLGGPDSLHAVRPFLYNLFSDREIIRLGPPLMQKPLAWLIADTTVKKDRSGITPDRRQIPILDITRAQAKALEKALNMQPTEIRRHGDKHLSISRDHPSSPSPRLSFVTKVYIGMRYWHPFIDDVLFEIHKNGIRKLSP